MNFDIELTDEAEKQYNALDDTVIKRINTAIEKLVENPFFGPNIVKLRGKLEGQYRYRVGSYRIVYNVSKEKHVITLKGFFQRGSAYR